MPKTTPSIAAKKPAAIGPRKLTVEAKPFFAALAKISLNVLLIRPIEAAETVPDLAASLGLGATNEERAWTLILRGFQRATCEILAEYFTKSADPAKAIADLNWHNVSTGSLHLEMDHEFFSSPASSTTARLLADSMEKWLAGAGLDAHDAKNLSDRMPGYFASGLHDEWRFNAAEYEPLLEELDSPFLPAAIRDMEWSRYRTALRSAVDEPVFEESFSLRQIYVPPRSYFIREAEKYADSSEKHSTLAVLGDDRVERHAVWLEEEILNWLDKKDTKSPVRLVSGGPGSGKSSFAKMLAAKLSEKERIFPLFIPLHLLDTDVGISRAISEFLTSSGYLSDSPIDNAPNHATIVLILDGLDELQMQGKGLQSVASQLASDIARLCDRLNSTGFHLAAVLTGRELSVQSAETHFKGDREVLHVAPYNVNQAGALWVDPEGILSTDQRDEWWRQYGRLTGKDYDGIPKNLRHGEMGEVTAQPLLNYLVSLSHARGGLDLGASTNINMVYADLLDAVHERGWAKSRHPGVNGVTRPDFIRLLEEVALSVWHGAGRTTTLKEVEDHCSRSNISALLPSFEQGSSTGVSNLLLAFYFRQKGRRETGDKTFEFTHKSFSEYLIGLRIIRAVDTIAKKIEKYQTDPDDGWDSDEALYRWVSIFGPTRMDGDILAFVRREIRLKGKKTASYYQRHLSRLFESGITRGWPMSRFNALSFNEQQRWSRNAEEALLCCINAAAIVTRSITEIKWPHRTSFGEVLARSQGQRAGPTNIILMDCLSFINLDGCSLDIADFFGANLQNSSLRSCELNYANFCRSDVAGTDFRESNFFGTLFVGTNISGAKFSKTVVQNSDMDASDAPIFIDSRRGRPAKAARVPMSIKEARERNATVEDDGDHEVP